MHEPDLTSTFCVEHFEMQSTHPELSNDYENCFWACALCNTNRAKPTEAERTAGAHLLNPSKTLWAAHFSIDEHGEMRPAKDDVDATYTARVYHLTLPNRAVQRKERALAVREGKATARRKKLIASLLRRAEETTNLELKRELYELAESMTSDLEAWKFRAERYAFPPMTASASCKCTAPHEEPHWLRGKLEEI
jgi:hypothetical protein